MGVVPEGMRGERFTIRRLLAKGKNNPKLKKSEGEYRIWGLSLASARSSGYQVCPNASKGCEASCLFEQGHARVFPSVKVARVARTVAYFEEREWFLSRLDRELANVARLAKRKGVKAAVRLNVFSDVAWEEVAPQLFRHAIQFYDYTKSKKRMLRFLGGDFPANYHLTFSRSEKNESACEEVLRAGGNVAVVFLTKPLPATWMRNHVSDGDQTDLRFLDPTGVVGLVAKGSAKQDQTLFALPVV